MADEPRVRYSATNRRAVGQIVVQFRRLRMNGNMGELITRYIASTHVPTATGNVKFGVESKMHPSVAAAFADLKDQLVNRYFVTGAIKIERSASDNVVNAQIDALKRSRNVNESFDNDYPNRKDHREPYHKASLRVSRTNRPGGDPDSWDAQNRTFSTRKRELAAKDALKNESLANRVLRVINKR